MGLTGRPAASWLPADRLAHESPVVRRYGCNVLHVSILQRRKVLRRRIRVEMIAVVGSGTVAIVVKTNVATAVAVAVAVAVAETTFGTVCCSDEVAATLPAMNELAGACECSSQA